MRRINHPDVIYRTREGKIHRHRRGNRAHQQVGHDRADRRHAARPARSRKKRPRRSNSNRPTGAPKETYPRDKIKEVQHQGRPVLVGTVSIEKSERLASLLDRRGIRMKCSTPSITSARRKSSPRPAARAAVTIATNMAGRGTDIVLGGNRGNDGLGPVAGQISHAARRSAGRMGHAGSRNRSSASR